MTVLLDTDVAIHLRDGGNEIRARMAELAAPPAISLISLVELKGGALTGPLRYRRRERLETMLRTVEIIGFDEAAVDVYADIVGRVGFSRPRILDRLIAATAIVNDLMLVTINGAHFRDIPGLKLEVWPVPAQ